MTNTAPSFRMMSHTTCIVFVVALAILFAACSGDAITNVDPDVEGESSNIPFLSLGEGEQTEDSTGSGRIWNAENQLITVNGMTFSDGGGSFAGTLMLEFFFGYVNRGTPDSVNVGLFVFSDEPFEGAVEAGAFEGQELRFSIDGYDVVYASRASDGTPLLGDGSRIPAYVFHLDDFSWTSSSGHVYHTMLGSSTNLKHILNYDSQEWEFDIDQGEFFINGESIGTVAGLKAHPFNFFFLYAGLPTGSLFIVSDSSFGEAVSVGTFEEQALRFEIDDYTVLATTKAPAMLGEGALTPAWVLHVPRFFMRDYFGDLLPHPVFGVSGTLEAILNQGQSGATARMAQNGRTLHMSVARQEH